MICYSSLRKDLHIKRLNGHAEPLAFLTHYLHNLQGEAASLYEAQAVAFYNATSNSKTCLKEVAKIDFDVPFPPPENAAFTFIDLFAGIGGFRIPLQDLGGKCVFSSEHNVHAQQAYELNFGEVPFGDITRLDLDLVPGHDVLCGGFPCQPFSISGKMKGFEDTRGTLIYHVFRIIEKRNPKVVFLENVKHLLHHDKGRTLETIIRHLEELGYKTEYKIVNASDFGVPQNRERIIIVGHRKKRFDFRKVKTLDKVFIKDILEDEGPFEFLEEPYTILDEFRTQESGLIFAGYRNKRIRQAGVRPGTEHLSRVHKQPNRIYSGEGIHPALPSQEAAGRFWIYHGGAVRKLTVRECYRLTGFPSSFQFIAKKSELYKQIGNSVCVPMIREIGREIKRQLLHEKEK